MYYHARKTFSLKDSHLQIKMSSVLILSGALLFGGTCVCLYVCAVASSGPTPLPWVHIPSRTAWEYSQEDDDDRGTGSQGSYLC